MAREGSPLYTPPAGEDSQNVTQPRCKACQHPDRHQIDLALQAGQSTASVARAHGLNELGLRNHKARHLFGSPVTAAARLKLDADKLCGAAERALKDAEAIADPVDRSQAVARATQAMRGALDLAARIRGELSNSSGTMAKTHLGMTLHEAKDVLDRYASASRTGGEELARQCVEYLTRWNGAHPDRAHWLPQPPMRRQRAVPQ